MPGEGKTVTAVNLALAAARANPERRILLIDADLRRSQVADVLGIRGKPGLAELLAGECEVRDVVRRFNATRLAVIPAGATPEEPTQVLASARMKQFLKAVRENFDEVYVDLPPTLPVRGRGDPGPPDGRGAHGGPRQRHAGQAVNQAVEQLGGAPMLGCVLNGAEVSDDPVPEELHEASSTERAAPAHALQEARGRAGASRSRDVGLASAVGGCTCFGFFITTFHAKKLTFFLAESAAIALACACWAPRAARGCSRPPGPPAPVCRCCAHAAGPGRGLRPHLPVHAVPAGSV